MWFDEVLEEIYKIREEHAKAFNYDLKAICDDLQSRQAASGRQLISKPLKKHGEWGVGEPALQEGELVLGDW